MKIDVYADGSGTHHADSPACIGVVVMLDDEPVAECSRVTGMGSNNVAELRAVHRALVMLERMFGRDVEAHIYSDSQYAIGCVDGQFYAQKNFDLVKRIREDRERFPHVRLVHVPGHAGVYGNEIADWLAGYARHRVLVERGQKHAGAPFRGRPKP